MSNPWDKPSTDSTGQKKKNPWDLPSTPAPVQGQPIDNGPLPEQPLSYAQRVRRATLAPGATLNKAMGQFGEGNPVAGLANVANAGMGMIGAGLSPLTEAPVVGPPLKNLLGAIPNLASKAVGAGEQAITATGVDPLANWGDPRKRQEAADAMHQVNTNIATIPLGKVMGEMSGVAKGAAVNALTAVEPIAKAKALSLRDFKMAAPALKNEVNYDASFLRASPYLAEQNRLTPIEAAREGSQVRQAANNARMAAGNLYTEKIQPMIDRHPDVVINGDKVASSVRSMATSAIKKENPGLAAQIEDYASRFQGELPLQEAHGLLKEINARSGNYHELKPEARAALDNAGMPMAIREAAADALRQNIDAGLQGVGETGLKNINRDYGAIKQMQKALERNIVKAEKPESPANGARRLAIPAAVGTAAELIGQHTGAPGLGTAAGIATYYASGKLKAHYHPNSLIERALGRLSDSPIRVPEYPTAEANIRGLLPPGRPVTEMGPGNLGGNQMNVTTTPRFILPGQQKLLTRGSYPLGMEEASGVNASRDAYPVPYLEPRSTGPAPGPEIFFPKFRKKPR